MNASSSLTSNSQVRVGVRIRPLTNNEKSQGGKSIISCCPLNRTTEILKRKFTYDAVYDSSVSQSDMYHSINNGSDGMLEAFLDGYNSTIMAYGQTGSGKTFTMGSEATASSSSASCSSSSSEASLIEDDDYTQGLIPRFMTDIFSSLESRLQQSHAINDNMSNSSNKSHGQLIDYSVSASFLEIWREEIYDLLCHDSKQTLPIRDDANGGVVVVGLNEKEVKSAEDALKILHLGTLNRTTAQTLMNKKSSRSHAVFTIYLKQTIREVSASKTSSMDEHKDTRRQDSGDEDFIDVSTTSKFTFVDLAGSERLKKTGAEGERAKEGIKINEGLLALGNVINALGDEERLLKGEKVHVPYRQSKLTRLLQDALGGNSKTLFLACVSPSDTNASETVSTLQYANRARNIKNAPTKNIDASVAELQRLYSLTNILEKELVKAKFRLSSRAEGTESIDDIGKVDNELMNREEVQNFLAQIYEKANEWNKASKPTKSDIGFQKTIAPSSSIYPIKNSENTSVSIKNVSVSRINADTKSQVEDETIATTIEVNPDEDIALLDKILELQHLDQEFDKENKHDQEKLKNVENELEEQESLLLQLKDNLKAYHNMKERFEAMMIEVQALESEKISIAKELERVQLDPTTGCSMAIKKRLEKVEGNLTRARLEARKHQNMYRKAEIQAQKVSAMEKKIESLKQGKVTLMKKQREAVAKHKESTDQKSREIMALKKKERKDGQKLSKLESEVQRHKHHLQRRAEFCDKLSEKLKQTESHLMKVLSMRRRDLQENSQNTRKRTRQSKSEINTAQTPLGFATDSQEVSSIKFLIEKIILDRASTTLTSKQYEIKVSEYSDLMRSMANEMKKLKNMKMKVDVAEQMSDLHNEIKECESSIEDLELRIEVVGSDLEQLRSLLPNGNETDCEPNMVDPQRNFENDAIQMISNLTAPVAKTLLWDILDIATQSEVKKSMISEKLKRKEAALRCFEQEIQSLNQTIELLHQDLQNDQAKETDIKDTSNPIRIKKAEIEQLEKLLAQLEQENKASQMNLEEKNEIIAVTRENLAIIETTLRNKGEEVAHIVQTTLEEMQTIWKEIGLSYSERDKSRLRIESCLEDTCSSILEDSKLQKENIQNDILNLLKTIKSMCYALGIEREYLRIEDSLDSKQTLINQKDMLYKEGQKILPFYNSSIEQLSKISSDIKSVMSSLELTPSRLSSNLAKVLAMNISVNGHKRRLTTIVPENMIPSESAKDDRAKKIKHVEEMMRALECNNFGNDCDIGKNDGNVNGCNSNNNFTEYEPKSLSEEFINECEKDLKNLKRIKSETMVANQICRDNAKTLANEMHLQGRELLSLGLHSIKKRFKDPPQWWDPQIAEEACRAIVSRECIINTSSTFTKHLNMISDSLESVSSGRRALSNCLKNIIEDAHHTLIKTVEGDIDADDAYSSFDKALSRLPKLSKEHIVACLDEMNTLIAAVHDMSQSETEALTVVWQALNVSNSERGQFWSDLNETAHSSTANNDFDEVKKACAEDIEEWVIAAIKESTKINRKLNGDLLKLSKIHQEVERLRSKQDTKSKIMSLDSELCILSSRLAEFEEKAGSKQRLVTKKVNSSSLLAEERFRKQIKSNFSSKLHSLVKLLNEWQLMEGRGFDEKMLSEDVNAFIKNPDQGGDWIQKRTAFMHLKTVIQKPRRKVLNEQIQSSSSSAKMDQSLQKKTTSKGRSIEQKENLQRHHNSRVRRQTSIANCQTQPNSPSKNRGIKAENTSDSIRQQVKRSYNNKNERVSKTTSKESCSTASAKLTPTRKQKRSIKIDTSTEDCNNSSPVLPFGSILAKTPVHSENTHFNHNKQ